MSKKISQLAAATSLSGGETSEIVQSGTNKSITEQKRKSETFLVTASGTDTYAATPSPALSSYVTNQKYYVLFTNANTGAATLNLNTLGVKAIKKTGSTALSAGDIAAGQIVTLIYDGTNFQIGGGAGGSGLTNSAVNNELMKSNGTNAVASGLFSSTAGDLTLGTSLAGTARTITAAGSGSNVDLVLFSKGSGNIIASSSTGSFSASSGTNANLALSTSGTGVTVISANTALTNSVFDAVKISHTTSGTPANGIGVSLQFEVETSNNNNEIGAKIKAVAIDTTSASEDFDVVIETMTAGAATTEKLRVTSDGRLYGTALHNNAGAVTGTTTQYVASGTYTPTLFNTTNLDASTAYVCQWIRVGNVVTVSGRVDIDPTVIASTLLGISLPIASNLASANGVDCAGTACASGSLSESGAITGDSTNDRASLSLVSVTTGNHSVFFTFTYLIL